MMARLLWWAVLGCVAVCAVFAQLDRSARFDAALSEMVPTVFAGFAAEHNTRRAIAAQDGEVALAQARRLLATRPLPAEHLALFAAAAAMAGEEQRSIAALELGMQRGWREPMAQQAAATAAIDQRRHDIAAMRIAALYAVGGQGDIASVYAAELVTTQEGREAFARRYAAQGHWQSQVPGSLADAATADDFAAAMTLARDAGAALDCRRLLSIADRYAREEEPAAAQQLRDICPA